MTDAPSLSLAAGDLRATFWPDSGMLGISLLFRGEEILRRIEDLESAKRKGSTAGIPLLYPWANRLAGLHYQAAGHDVTLDPKSSFLHFDDKGLPMHGVPWGQLSWKVLQAKPDSLICSLDWNRPELLAVFPFPHHLQIEANISRDSLTIQTTILADAGSPVPVSFGFHPYFGIPHLPRAQWRLQLPAMRKLVLDSHGIPSGAEKPFKPVDTLLGDTNFDDGFALANPQSSFVLSGAAYKIAVEFLEGFAYTQVYAPKDKEFIALEPMTAPTNALITGEGLQIVAAGKKFQSSFRIRIHHGN
jgi:aldose 1-epimerase